MVRFNFFSRKNIQALKRKHQETILEARENQVEGNIKEYALKILEADRIARLISLAHIRLSDN